MKKKKLQEGTLKSFQELIFRFDQFYDRYEYVSLATILQRDNTQKKQKKKHLDVK